MVRNSTYQDARTFRNERRSGLYDHLPENIDRKFDCHVFGRVFLYFVLNLLVTLLWTGFALGILFDWGANNPEGLSNRVESYDCDQYAYRGHAIDWIQKDQSYHLIVWEQQSPPSLPSPHQPPETHHNITINKIGLYAIISVLQFTWNAPANLRYSIRQSVRSSRGLSSEDNIEANIGSRSYRSFIYTTFDLEEGDTLWVQVEFQPLRESWKGKNIVDINFHQSYLSFYRIRNPMKCPRKDSRTSKALKNESETPKLWWSRAYLASYSCGNSECEEKIVDGETGFCVL